MHPPADAPVTEDDAFIAAALERASIPTLMMSILHLTGDASLLRGSIRPGTATSAGPAGRVRPDDAGGDVNVRLAS